MITINKKRYLRGYTHSGKFHTDEVACAALLKMIDSGFHIYRGFQPLQEEETLVFDIGGGRYDHHSAPYESRDNGIPYAALGKLWRDIWPQFNITEKQAKEFDEDIVQPLDLADCTGRMNPLTLTLSSMNPTWDNPTSGDSEFWQAVGIITTLFKAYLNRARSVTRAESDAEQTVKNSPYGIAVADHYAPSSAFKDKVFFAICPSQRGGWQAISIKKEDGVQLLFPESWRGSKENLPDGVSFCHNGGWLACFDSEAQAIAACEKCIEQSLGLTEKDMSA